MDTSDPDIQFDDSGGCSHCHHYQRRVQNELFEEKVRKERLDRLVRRIKEEGKNKEYDCLIGVSGGVDSTMVAYTAKKLGLRPLAIHMDNGWNSELAVANVEKVLKTLDIDLYTHVIDWEEFRDLHLAFLKSSVVNSEVPTDHAILAILYRIATQRKIRYILSGGNIVTEAIMPFSWVYDAKDWRHLSSIHRTFGKVELKTFPHFTLWHFLYWTFTKRIKFIPILNYVSYVKQDAIKLLKDELGWRDYGGKHFESIYTRFYQAYILPRKFNFDKRRAHLSTLICSGQMTRDEALKSLEKSPYPENEIEEDKAYVIKKLGLTPEEFEEIMSQPIKTYKDYSSNDWILHRLPFVVSFIKKVATARV